MARAAATLSPCSSLSYLPSSTKLLQPSVSAASNLSFPHQRLCFHHPITPSKSPTIIICRAKLDGSVGEDPEGIGEVFFDDNDLVEDESDEDETESSVDLLIRFLQSMFKKLSRRAKRASRAMLPTVISPQLVSFAVDGILLLAALSIVKALLEVVCTLGSTVFSVILLLRLIWAAISYFQSNENTFNRGGSSFGTAQPAA